MSPDVFLSRAGIRYDGSGLQGTPEDIVANLTILNDTRTWQMEPAGFEYTTYSTPGYISTPPGPNTFSRKKQQEEAAAVRYYYETLKYGSLFSTHNAVDKINAIRMAKGGGGEFGPVSDFEILGNGNGTIGYAARWLTSEALRAEEDDGPPPWFFTKSAYDALKAYAKGDLK